MSEPTHYKQKQEKSGDTIAENKHRKEEEKQKRFFLPPKKISRNEMERAILGGGRSFQFNGRTLRGAAYRLHRRTCYTKKEPPRRILEVLKVAATYSPTTQCSTIGDAELNDPVRNGKGWDLSAITT